MSKPGLPENVKLVKSTSSGVMKSKKCSDGRKLHPNSVRKPRTMRFRIYCRGCGFEDVVVIAEKNCFYCVPEYFCVNCHHVAGVERL